MEQLKKKYAAETPQDEQLAEAKVRIRESFQRNTKQTKGLLSSRRLMIYLVLLLALLWWVLQ